MTFKAPPRDKISHNELSNLIYDIMTEEVKKIKDFDGFDPKASSKILGIRIMDSSI